MRSARTDSQRRYEQKGKAACSHDEVILNVMERKDFIGTIYVSQCRNDGNRKA